MNCIFCEIVAGRAHAVVLHEEADLIAIRDIVPQAPVHFLVMPREHIESLAELGDAHDSLWVRILHVVQEVAAREGLSENGYRVLSNVGAGGGQTVPHLHVHVLGGRQMRWPPG